MSRNLPGRTVWAASGRCSGSWLKNWTGRRARIPTRRPTACLGLCAALERFKRDKVPLDGDLARAKSYVDESIDYAYAAQNTDGSWGRPTSRDYATAVSYTAHMLQWLVTTLPVNRLEGPPIVRAIDFLHNTLNSSHYQAYIPTMSTREISAAMHAACVLNAYDQRVFVPADPPPATEPAKAEKPAQKSASRAGQTR